MTAFSQNIIKVIESIPKGKVASYGLIAMLAGNPRGSRIVGYMTHRLKQDLPYHRVVFKDGSLCEGTPFGHPEIQRQMLVDEGVQFLPDGRVDLSISLWEGQ